MLSHCHLFHLPTVRFLSLPPSPPILSPPLRLWSLACVAANIHSGSDQGNGPHTQMGGSPGWQEVPPGWVMCLSCDLGHVTYTTAMSCDHGIFVCHAGIVGLNNIKANDYMNIVLQVRWWFDWITHVTVASQNNAPMYAGLEPCCTSEGLFPG